MMTARKLFYTVLASTLFCCGQAHAREWTDGSGQYSIEAEFVELVGETVKLRRSDGEVISVPLEKLCWSDQHVARQLAGASAGSADWVSLFNGRDLTGWHGDPKLWHVEDGAIVGEAPAGIVTSNLCTEQTYEDFVLKMKFKLVLGNSGVLVRSRELANFKMTGPQVDVQPDPQWMGLVYVEGDKGTVMREPDGKQTAQHCRPNDWNEYVITCHGSQITVELNGYQTLDYVDRSGQVEPRGKLGLQLFAPKQPTTVWFKDIRLRPLKAASAGPREPAALSAGEWVSLFNGRDLTGWHGDPKLWRVENGAMVGEAPAGIISNLSSESTYEDFALRTRFKLTSGNSGIHVRSCGLARYKMSGPQVDILSDTRFLGGLTYVEEDKGAVMGQSDVRQAAHAYRPNGWNEFAITCHGSRITVELNGHQTLDYVDRSGQVDRAGVIGLQLFAPGQPTSVSFKDVRIRKLDPPDPRIAKWRQSPPPRPIALPDPMPDARFLELQVGNHFPQAKLVPKHVCELADNRIADQRGGSLHLSTPTGSNPKGDDAFIHIAAGLGFKWLRFSMDAYEGEPNTRPTQVRIMPGQIKTLKLLSDSGTKLNYTINYWETKGSGGVRQLRYREGKEIQRFLDYARLIASRFKGLVGYYDILNEPEKDLRAYVNLVRRVVPVIRREDPGVKISVGGGVFPIDQVSREFLFGLLKSDIMPLADAVNVHPMFSVSPQYPDSREYYYGYPSLVRQMKHVAAAHGFKGEWLAHGMDWRTAANPSPWWPWQYTENVAAKYYARGIVMHLGMDSLAGIGSAHAVRPAARVVQNLCTVMAGNRPANLPLEIQSPAERITSYTFSLPNNDRLIAVWDDNVAADHHRGEPSTVIVKGFKAKKVTAIDVLYSSEQEMITETEGGNLVIRDLLVKDYPIILRLTR
jgi:hypothetical protein